MKIKCEYCDNTYEDTLPQCPYCDAPNPSHQQVKGAPKTIADLQQWYKDRNLPPYETTRFFIGEDHQGPRAFGIYQDPSNGEFIVYKNKDDGSRAVRYRGSDEEYAVNELYLKLKDEIVHQKARTGYGSPSPSSSGKKSRKMILYGAIGIAMAGYFVGSVAASRHNGYYNYNNTVYYNYDNSWYYYDDVYDDWYETGSYDPGVNAIQESYDDYYVSSSWNSDVGATDWDNTEYYEETHSSSSSSDSDYDWDSGSDWDSGGTDWDSDW